MDEPACAGYLSDRLNSRGAPRSTTTACIALALHPARLPLGMDVTLGELRSRLGDPGLLLLDVRTDAEYTGAAGYPCDPRQGHIPGARHVELARLFEASAEEIRALVGAPEGAEVIAYCHSGSRSSLATVSLRAAGYEARNYAGSWHEWSRNEELPVQVDGLPPPSSA